MAIGRFPKNPTDGAEVSDKYSNRWQYSAENEVWVSRGVVRTQELVSEDRNGIIDPDIYNKLAKLDQYVKANANPDVLKLYPGLDAYWYYLRSSDKLFRFRPEGPSDLRIEIDKGRLFQILMKQICPGKRGPKGQNGDKGRASRPGPPEICYFPSTVDEARLDFAIFTPTPLQLDGPVDLPNERVPEVSVRVFKVSEGVVASKVDQLQHMAIYFNGDGLRDFLPKFERTRGLLLQRALGQKSAANLCDIPMSDVAVFSTGAEVDVEPSATVEISPVEPFTVSVFGSLPVDVARTQRSVKFDPETNIVCGSIYLLAGNRWDSFSKDWCVKSRQRGPDGEKGDSGEPYMRVVECTLDDTNLAAICPIVNVRLDCDLDIVYTLCTDLLEEVCVGLVRLLPDSGILSDVPALKSVFAAAQMTLDECKFVDRFEIRLESDEVPDLELVHWDPQPGCLTKRNYDRHEFNWMPLTDVPVCESGATWFGPSSVRPGRYPWEIVFAPEPESDPCCQDDFFWCPNVQDAPLYCPSGTSYVPPPPPPPPPPSSSSTSSSPPSSSSLIPPSSSSISSSSSSSSSSLSCPSGCDDEYCTWQWTGSPAFEWVLFEDCSAEGCHCPGPPESSGSSEGQLVSVCCEQSSSSSSSSLSCPSECDYLSCLWIWEANADPPQWTLFPGEECGAGCQCSEPDYEGTEDLETARTCCEPSSTSTSSNSNCFVECNGEFCSWIWDGENWMQVVSCGAGCECEATPILDGTNSGDTFSVCCIPISSSSSTSSNSNCFVECNGEYCSWVHDGTSWIQALSCGAGCECEATPILPGASGDTFSVCCIPSSSSSSSSSSLSLSDDLLPEPSVIPPLTVPKSGVCGWIWIGKLDDGHWELFTSPCSDNRGCSPPNNPATEEGQIEYTDCLPKS